MVHTVSFHCCSLQNKLVILSNHKFAKICYVIHHRYVQADPAIHRRLPQQATNCSVCLKDVSPKQYDLFMTFIQSLDYFFK